VPSPKVQAFLHRIFVQKGRRCKSERIGLRLFRFGIIALLWQSTDGNGRVLHVLIRMSSRRIKPFEASRVIELVRKQTWPNAWTLASVFRSDQGEPPGDDSVPSITLQS
jgi:hypothetical protein